MIETRIERLATVDSTNAEAMRRALAGEEGPLWIVADEQTVGRGRSGRSWMSASGNLAASLLVRLDVSPAKAPQLALVAGIAVIDAIRSAMIPAPPELRLKWPNDILIGGAKAGGILVESSMLPRTAERPAALAAVVGIGLNVATSPEALDQPATALADHGSAPSADVLLRELAAKAAGWLAIWTADQDFGSIRDAWLNRAHPIGERLRINTGTERISGSFEGLDADGALLLGTETGRRRFTFGDVSLER